MKQEILILGYGPVGRATTARLLAGGGNVRIAQRRRPADMPEGVTFTACDVLDPVSLGAAIAGATQVVASIGLPYDGAVWLRDWPIAMANLIDACAAHDARLVFLDNLYMYGPQTGPLTETTVLSHQGRKPAARSIVTQLWQEAAATGRVRIAALRAPDFYGPGVAQSHLGDSAFGALARGKAAMLAAPADVPHDFAYVPDIGRAIVMLLDAPDSDFGRAWHMPCAPIQSMRQILALGTGTAPRVLAIPLALLPLLGLAVPMLREMAEMRFQWDRRYDVDGSDFTRRFGFVPTPFAIGAVETARAFGAAPAVAV